MKTENYLDKIPKRNDAICWSVTDGAVTLEVVNKGIFNALAQKLFKKPKISYVHLDKIGSFLWQEIDTKRTVFDLGKGVKAEFGDDAEPLYERLCDYIRILESYGFVFFIS